QRDIRMEYLSEGRGASVCEWKGPSRYWNVQVTGAPLANAAWDYPDPYEPYQALAGKLCFYPTVLECYLDDERVRPQPGGFYGGWVTANLTGPIKGEPGSESW
ncbi:MAG: DUF427 domain-containing protein, partial [Myxococcota bacterium]